MNTLFKIAVALLFATVLAFLIAANIRADITFSTTYTTTTSTTNTSFDPPASAVPWEIQLPAGLGVATQTWVSNSIVRIDQTNLALFLKDSKGQGNTTQPNKFNFTAANGSGAQLPATSKLQVVINGSTANVVRLDWKRYPAYSHNEIHDPYVVYNFLTLNLTNTVKDGDTVKVVNADNTVFTNIPYAFTRTFSVSDFNPAISVNQVGYHPNLTKQFNFGWYAGTNMLELTEASVPFNVFDLTGQSNIFSGTATLAPDGGWTVNQKVYAGDFSSVTKQGRYAIRIPNWGQSLEFRIDENYPTYVMRTAAKGVWCYACSTNISSPYFSITQPGCHGANGGMLYFLTNASQSQVNGMNNNANSSNGDWNKSLFMTNKLNACTGLWSYVNTTPLPMKGGYHDAGDYSFYMQNEAISLSLMLHALDSYPGSKTDSLDLPFSGDGIPDLAQMIKWGMDALPWQQDTDGGAYTLCYPEFVSYENTVPGVTTNRIAYPKDTVPTFSLAAVCAQASSSPTMQRYYPDDCTNWFRMSTNAFNWATTAVTRAGITNSYRPSYPYGISYGHMDELAWAGFELYMATTNTTYANYATNYTPTLYGSSTQREGWTWWPLFQAFGRVQADIAFSVQSGRLKPSAWTPYQSYFADSTNEVAALAIQSYGWGTNSAYGTPFALQEKAGSVASYYFGSDMILPCVDAYELQRFYGNLGVVQTNYLKAVTRMFDWEMGSNPGNKCRWAGIGINPICSSPSQWDRYDTLLGPPTGYARGSMIQLFNGGNWGTENANTVWPPVAGTPNTQNMPLPERQAQDCFETSNGEATIHEQADNFIVALWMKGVSEYCLCTPTINVTPAPKVNTQSTVTASLAGIDLSQAIIGYEINSNGVVRGSSVTWTPAASGSASIRCFIQTPNGQNYDGTQIFTVSP